jgi:PTH1 family peptidyl-tRNA hydrolase
LRPLVICDDLALPLGAARLRGKGSSGGQNGVQSIIEHIGGEIFPRLRLGIAPRDQEVPPEFWPDYVLADFEPREHAAVAEVVAHAADAVEYYLEHGTEATGSRFNRKRPPQED